MTIDGNSFANTNAKAIIPNEEIEEKKFRQKMSKWKWLFDLTKSFGLVVAVLRKLQNSKILEEKTLL